MIQRIYEGYYNDDNYLNSLLYPPKIKNYISTEEYLLEKRCNALGLYKYSNDIVSCINYRKIYEEDGVVRVFDKYIDNIAHLILNNIHNAPKNNYYELLTDYVFKYDDSIKDNKKRSVVDLYDYHNTNGIIDENWHRICFGLINNINDYDASVLPRNLCRTLEDFLPDSMKNIWLNNDNIYITFNFARLDPPSTGISYINQIKYKLSHEFTHVLPRWAHKFRDILCTKKNIMLYCDEFPFKDNAVALVIIKKITKTIHDVKKCELDAFYNQYISFLDSCDDNFFINIFNETDDEDKQVDLLISSTYDYNHVFNIEKDLEEIEKIDINNRIDALYILLLSYYFRKYNYITCPDDYKKFLNIPFINGYANDKVDVSIDKLKNLYKKIKIVFYANYSYYINKKLPKRLKKYLAKKKSEII